MLTDISMESPITLVATPLFGITAKGEKVLAGTGVVVLPYVILTAKHVIDEFVKTFNRDAPPRMNASSDGVVGSMYGFIRSLTGGWIPFRVMKVSTSDRSDLALLTVAVSEDAPNDWACPSIQLTPPQVGQAINAFGFPGTDLEIHNEENKNSTGRIFLTPSATEGVVTEVYHDRRDSVSLYFPCFETTAQFEGAMSGGPVFHDGRLCGVICSSFTLSDGGPHIGYVSSIWPALALEVFTVSDSGSLESRLFMELLKPEQAAEIGNFSVTGSELKQVSMRFYTQRSTTFLVSSSQPSEVTSIKFNGRELLIRL